MIKLQMSEIINSTDALKKLAGMSLKARLAFQVSRLLKAIDKEVQDFNETRMSMIKKYGEKDENNELKTDDKGNCKIPEENISAFTEEFNDLAKTEVEINANRIKIDDLEDVNFTPAEMSQLEPFIDFGEEAEEE